MLKQQVVHFPEAVLLACRFGGFGGALSVGKLGEVAEDNAEGFLGLQGLQEAMGMGGGGALVVTVKHEGDGCIKGALDAIAIAHR